MRSFALGLTGDTTVNVKTAAAVTAGAKSSIPDGVYTVSSTGTGATAKYDLVDNSGTVVASGNDGMNFKNVIDNSNTIALSDPAFSGKVTINGAAATADSTIANANTGLEAGTFTYDSVKDTLADGSGNLIATGDGTGQNFKVNGVTVLALSATAKLTATNTSVTIHGVDVSNKFASNKAISTIQKALDNVSAQRSTLGAYQNRLEHTINNLGTSSENLTSAESRIRDVDMAKEMSTYSKNNILSQAAQAMLAQANQQPQQVLSLLR
jgi:flagellin